MFLFAIYDSQHITQFLIALAQNICAIFWHSFLEETPEFIQLLSFQHTASVSAFLSLLEFLQSFFIIFSVFLLFLLFIIFSVIYIFYVLLILIWEETCQQTNIARSYRRSISCWERTGCGHKRFSR